MKSKKTILLILIIIASMIPEARAITPQSQTVKIIDTRDDMFITEVGIGIDSSLVTIKDPDMDIRSFFVFRELDINYWEPLKNATLRLHTSNTLSFDADSSITIYGMALSDLQYEGFLSPSTVLSLGFTSAHTDYNTSEFYGGQWHEINVTDIVEELIRNPNWDGDGHAGTETGDAIGFHILGAEGDDKRYFYDFSVGNGLEAQLVIHWNHEPPPPTGYEKAEYVGEYGDYTIWYMNETGSNEPIEYRVAKGHAAITFTISYDYVHSLPGIPIAIDLEQAVVTSDAHSQRKLVRTGDGTLHVCYTKKVGGQLYYEKSVDNGATWIGATELSTGAGMDSYVHDHYSMAVDSEDNLHVTWKGKATGLTTDYQIFYNKYNDTDSSWDGPLWISNATGMQNEQNYYPAIAVDSDDYIHIVFQSEAWTTPGTYPDQIWYANYTTSWEIPIWISNATGMQVNTQLSPSIAVDSSDYLHVIWAGKATGFANNQIWYANRTTSWAIPVNISSNDFIGYVQKTGCIAIDSDDNLHIVWTGHSADHLANDQIWYINDITGWSAPLRISTYTGMDSWEQFRPSMGIDDDDYLYVLWDWAKPGDSWYDVWYAKYETDWDTPYRLQDTGTTNTWYANVRWSKWPRYWPEQFIVTDENGTVIQEDLDTQEDAEDWIDIYDPDPEDPNPADLWDEVGPFTRFRTRLYILLMGFGLLFGPLFYFAMRRPSGYEFVIGLFIMLVGYSFLRAAAGI